MPDAVEPHVTFQPSVLEAGDLVLRRMDGHEAISRLFEFTIVAQTARDGMLDVSALQTILKGRAHLGFGEAGEYKLHGVVREIEMLAQSGNGPTQYRFSLVPTFWYATQVCGSWVYQDMTTPEIIQDVLVSLGLEKGKDFDLHLTGKYAKREYVVQYEETDFDFVSRWMEHEGIFYYFEHGDDRDKLVIADGNTPVPEVEGSATIPFDPRAGIDHASEVVTSLGLSVRQLPSKVILKDYNYRTPALALEAEAPVLEDGRGMIVAYGDHFKDVAAGKRLAGIRAEEMNLRRITFTGGSRVRALRAGRKFALENHPIADFEMEYLVTDVRHSVVQGESDANASSVGYTNEFGAIPFATPFRPACITPKPSVRGIIHAHVDGTPGLGTATPVDEYGRYKVVLPFDVGGKKGGKASRWVRMAQPSAGSGYGMHFPLHVGTEVVLAHIDGDPDRPIIVGSVPNHETQSPVNRTNPTQSAIKTRGGIHVGFDDDAP